MLEIFKNYKKSVTLKFKTAGFTLIELLVVISIITLLSSVVLVAVADARDKAQVSKAKSEMGEFVKALEIYRTSEGLYPQCPPSFPKFCMDNTIASQTDFTDNISNALKSKKIYSGNLVNSLKTLPNVAYVVIVYITKPSFLDIMSGDGMHSCAGNKKFSNYSMTVVLLDKNNNYLYPELANSYFNKELNQDGIWTGGLCAGN